MKTICSGSQHKKQKYNILVPTQKNNTRHILFLSKNKLYGIFSNNNIINSNLPVPNGVTAQDQASENIVRIPSSI